MKKEMAHNLITDIIFAIIGLNIGFINKTFLKRATKIKKLLLMIYFAKWLGQDFKI